MSRKSSLSQPTKNTRHVNKGLSQRTITSAFAESDISDADLLEYAHNVVRYILFKGAESCFIGKKEILKNVMFKYGKYFEKVMEKTISILHTCYGFNLLAVDATSQTKGYILSNALPQISALRDSEYNEEIPDDANKVLLLLILSHIFMSTESVTEASLFGFLNKLGIDVNVSHEVFGSVKDCITNDFIKQKYLQTEEDTVTKQLHYMWGIRSEKEISKMDVLKFVCKMCNDKSPETWDYQYSVAQQQQFKNIKITQNEEPHDDEDNEY